MKLPRRILRGFTIISVIFAPILTFQLLLYFLSYIVLASAHEKARRPPVFYLNDGTPLVHGDGVRVERSKGMKR